MSARLALPASQQRHSNIAVVRYSKYGKRLEIACYKNKLVAYRGGVETRLDEVLQIDRVFLNVSRGEYASDKDINACFGGVEKSEQDAILHILKNGEMQVSERERKFELEETMKDICQNVASRVVHPKTLRPYPTSIIELAIKELGYSVRLDMPLKKQSLQVIKLLVDAQPMPIVRAPMKIRVTVPLRPQEQEQQEQQEQQKATTNNKSAGEVMGILEPFFLQVLRSNQLQQQQQQQQQEQQQPQQQEQQEQPATLAIEALILPESFRQFDSTVKEQCGGTVQVLDTAVMDTSEGSVGEIARMVSNDVDPTAQSHGGEEQQQVVDKIRAQNHSHVFQKGPSRRDDDNDDAGDSEEESPKTGGGKRKGGKKGRKNRKGSGGGSNAFLDDNVSSEGPSTLSGSGGKHGSGGGGNRASAALHRDLEMEIERTLMEHASSSSGEDDDDADGASSPKKKRAAKQASSSSLKGGRQKKGGKQNKSDQLDDDDEDEEKEEQQPAATSSSNTGNKRAKREARKVKKIARLQEEAAVTVDEEAAAVAAAQAAILAQPEKKKLTKAEKKKANKKNLKEEILTEDEISGEELLSEKTQKKRGITLGDDDEDGEGAEGTPKKRVYNYYDEDIPSDYEWEEEEEEEENQ